MSSHCCYIGQRIDPRGHYESWTSNTAPCVRLPHDKPGRGALGAEAENPQCSLLLRLLLRRRRTLGREGSQPIYLATLSHRSVTQRAHTSRQAHPLVGLFVQTPSLTAAVVDGTPAHIALELACKSPWAGPVHHSSVVPIAHGSATSSLQLTTLRDSNR